MNFDPNMIETTFIEPMTPYGPVEGRRYTLTHSDETGMMFLDISDNYNFEAIDEVLRDELLGSWKLSYDGSYKLFFYAYVGDSDFASSMNKYNAFKYHMNLALTAIMYGDRELFKTNEELLNTPIYVKFDSSNPMFNGYESYGYVKDYIL